MCNVLGISLDYLMLKNEKVRGDVRQRQFDYARQLGKFVLIVYTPKELNMHPQQWTENLFIYPTNSASKVFFFLDALKIAFNLCAKNNFDLITCEDPFSTGLAGYVLKKKYHIPLNIQVHCNFTNNPYWLHNRPINLLFNLIGKFTLRKADTIRVGTQIDKQNIATLGIPEEKIAIIPVHMDVEKFSAGAREPIRTKLLQGKFQHILLFVGRLSKEKDLGTLLKAFKIIAKKYAGALLLLIGSGQEELRLREMSKKLKIDDRVNFTGSISHESLPDYLAAADVFIISSLFDRAYAF